MRRVLGTFLYYMRWQRVMAWTTGIGAALVILGLILGEVLPPRIGFFPVMFGSVLFMVFPILFAGVAFRELVSNRRFVMVPEFRSHAAGGLLLLALSGTGVCLIFASEIWPDVPISDPVRFVLLAFSAISAYLLISQWLVIYSLGLIGFVLLPLFVLRLWINNGPLTASSLTAPWLLAATALLGWLWLIFATRHRAVARPLATPAWGISSAPELQEGRAHHHWLPQWGRAASPIGTILRGMPDGTGNRIAFVLMAMLTFPVTMWLVLFLLGAPIGPGEQGPFGSMLVWSLLGVCMLASSVIREWPARLRYLWLRTSGDRFAGWQLLERSLLADIVLIASVATLIALLFGLFSAIELKYLTLYVAGCVGITWFAAYAGFWTRASNWHEIVHASIVLLVAFLCFGGVAFTSETPERVYWVPAILVALTIVARALAKHQLTRVDWCAVRPARMRRKNV